MKSNIATIDTISFTLPGIPHTITINPNTIILSWVIILFLSIAAFLIGRRAKIFPGKIQVMAESIIAYFMEVGKETLGEGWKKFFPLIVTLFVFILLCNWISIIPGIKSPTSDLNTCLGLGLMVFFIAHVSAIMHKGLLGYIKAYFRPFFLFFPINVVGEFGKVISHSFRLFGNMFAGGIILALVGPIVFQVSEIMAIPKLAVSPVVIVLLVIMQAFYGIFIGLIQAFVFSMLALTYIAVARE